MKIKVCAAVIVKNNMVLAAQRDSTRSNALKWEFPGGKIEDGESEEDCIVREIREELNIDIQVNKKIASVIHNYSDFQIELMAFLCKIVSGEICCKEHHKVQWFKKKELNNIDWADADKKILSHLIQNNVI